MAVSGQRAVVAIRGVVEEVVRVLERQMLKAVVRWPLVAVCLEPMNSEGRMKYGSWVCFLHPILLRLSHV